MNARKKYSGPIESWSTFRSPFDAPELPPSVQGLLPNGRQIITSRVVRSEGRRVWTENGSEYELGEPDPKFIEWLASNDYQFDPEHPIRMVKKLSHLKPPSPSEGEKK